MRLLVDDGVGERDRIISSTFAELDLTVAQVVAASRAATAITQPVLQHY